MLHLATLRKPLVPIGKGGGGGAETSGILRRAELNVTFVTRVSRCNVVDDEQALAASAQLHTATLQREPASLFEAGIKTTRLLHHLWAIKTQQT